ncbi:MAG: hypothetical protein ACKOTB_01190 [Planctomycetia bacterium]
MQGDIPGDIMETHKPEQLPGHVDTLRNLSPLEAIQALLCEHLGHGEERYLVAAIMRDRRIELDDDEVSYMIQDARRQGVEATAVLDRLLALGDGVQASAGRPRHAR